MNVMKVELLPLFMRLKMVFHGLLLIIVIQILHQN